MVRGLLLQSVEEEVRNAVKYKGVWLCRGSVAYELHEAKEWQKLDKHMKQLDKNEHMLVQFGRYVNIEGTKEC